MKQEKLINKSKKELIDAALLKSVGGGACGDACSEWVESCGSDSGAVDWCGEMSNICNYSEINEYLEGRA